MSLLVFVIALLALLISLGTALAVWWLSYPVKPEGALSLRDYATPVGEPTSYPRLPISRATIRRIGLYGITSLRESVALLPLVFALKEHMRRVKLYSYESGPFWLIWHSWGLIDGYVEPGRVGDGSYEPVDLLFRSALLSRIVPLHPEVASERVVTLRVNEGQRFGAEGEGITYHLEVPSGYPLPYAVRLAAECLVGRGWTGVMPLYFSETVDLLARDALSRLKLKDYVVIAPHASKPCREIPSSAVHKLIWELSRYDLPLLLLGDAESASRVPVTESENLLDLRGKVNLGVAFTISLKAKLIVAGDNFFRQVADVFDIPMVTYGFDREENVLSLPTSKHGTVLIGEHTDINRLSREARLLYEDGLAFALIEAVLELLSVEGSR